MKKRCFPFLLAVAVLGAMMCQGTAFASTGEGEPLSVVGGEPMLYVCDNGDELVVRYFTLSDESLRFVKILFPDGTEYTLPQVLSASGARYTDDIELLWWVKGDSAYVEKRDNAGEWRPLYKECRNRP